MLEVLPEGRHFLNPIFWSREKHKVVDVPVGKCLVLTRKFGNRISARPHRPRRNPGDREQ